MNLCLRVPHSLRCHLSSGILVAALFGSFQERCVALVTPTPDPQHTTEGGLQKQLKSMGRSVEAFPFWRNMGLLNQSTGVYMGGGRVLTAAHVGAGTFTLQDGTSYKPIRGSERRFRNPDGSYADLLLFQVSYQKGDSLTKLPSVPIRRVCPSRSCPVLLLGAGSGNASQSARPVSGFRWNENSRLRWGFNRVEYTYTESIETFAFRTPGYSTRFARGELQCQATPGDSGGGVFAFHPVFRRWELCGIILAVDGQEGKAAYGNQTYIGDLTIIPKHAFSGRSLLVSH